VTDHVTVVGHGAFFSTKHGYSSRLTTAAGSGGWALVIKLLDLDQSSS